MKWLIVFGLVVSVQSMLDSAHNADMYCRLGHKFNCQSPACLFTMENQQDNWCGGSIVKLDISSILKIHNDIRQKIASGDQTNLPSASQMTELKWNDELAHVALYNVKTCGYGHDSCRTTRQFITPGQNKESIQGDEINVEEEITNIINSWFNEIENYDESVISSYNNSSKTVEYFSQMVKDSITHVGCSAIHFKDTDYQGHWWENLYLVCNYSDGNYIGEPVYITGVPASQCSKGSKNYSALCQF